MSKRRVSYFVKKNRRYISIGILSLCVGFLFHAGLSVLVHAMQNSPEPEKKIDEYPSEVRKSAKRITDRCKEKLETERCFADEFGRLTQETSIEHAIQTLKATQAVSERARGCHLISHEISIAETKKDPTKWRDIIGVIPPDDCTGGFIHGIIEVYMAYDSEFKISSQTIPEICSIVNEATGFRGKHLACAHSMGHLVMVETGGFVEPAVTVCGAVPEELQYQCYSGVFMENETRENLIAHEIKDQIRWNVATTKEQEALCRKYDGIAAKACWREVAHMFAFISEYDPVTLDTYCSLAPDYSFRDDCYLHGIGVLAVSEKTNPDNFSLFCTPYTGNSSQFSKCMTASVRSMIFSTPEYASRSIMFCKAMPEDYKEECFTKVMDYIYYVVKDATKREKYCASMPTEYKESCVAAS